MGKTGDEVDFAAARVGYDAAWKDSTPLGAELQMDKA